MGIFSKIKSFFSVSHDTLSYENLNTDISQSLSTNDKFIGSRAEVSTQLTRNSQFTSSFLLTDPSLFNFTLIIKKLNGLCFTTIDQSKNFHTLICGNKNGFSFKTQSMVSKTKGIFSEVGINKSTGNCNFGFKLIQQAVENSPLIISNFCGKSGNFYFGNEIVVEMGEKNEVGLSFGVRKETEKGIFVAKLQQFTAFNFMAYKRFSESICGGFEFSHSLLSRQTAGMLSLKCTGKKTTVKTSVDLNGVFVTLIENRISERILVYLSSEFDLMSSGGCFGVSMSLHL